MHTSLIALKNGWVGPPSGIAWGALPPSFRIAKSFKVRWVPKKLIVLCTQIQILVLRVSGFSEALPMGFPMSQFYACCYDL